MPALSALAVGNALQAGISRLRLLIANERPLSAEERAELAYQHIAWCQQPHCRMLAEELAAEDEP